MQSSEKKDSHLLEAKRKIFDKIDELEKLIGQNDVSQEIKTKSRKKNSGKKKKTVHHQPTNQDAQYQQVVPILRIPSEYEHKPQKHNFNAGYYEQALSSNNLDLV